MPRPKKEVTHINIIMRQDIHNRFCEYADEKGQTKTMVIERTIQRALDEEDKQKKHRE